MELVATFLWQVHKMPVWGFGLPSEPSSPLPSALWCVQAGLEGAFSIMRMWSSPISFPEWPLGVMRQREREERAAFC